MRVLIFVVLIGTALAVPRGRSPQRVMGGSPTTIEQYPFMANMQYGWLGSLFSQACGGSLLTTTSVLSAAHCFIGTDLYEWRVALGTTFASFYDTEHEVTRMIIHEKYDNAYFDSDVAIIKLATPAVLSDSVRTVRIAGPNYNLPDGTALTIIGWGALVPGYMSPEQLHHVEVNQINQELCVERYAYLKTQPGYYDWPDVTPNMICVGILDVGGKDACTGDSGGPLIHSGDTVVGITSWGYSCGDPMYPGVNVRVSKYASWIVENASW